MKLYFSISELCIDADHGLPFSVADKLLKHHIWVMNPVRIELNSAIWASSHSGYRHKGWERQRNRAPDDPKNNRKEWSRHTFAPTQSQKDPDGLGAIDWTTRPAKIVSLGELLLKTDYSRICYYPDDKFYHCDYGWRNRGQRVFVNDGGWQLKSEDEWLKIINNVG